MFTVGERDDSENPTICKQTAGRRIPTERQIDRWTNTYMHTGSHSRTLATGSRESEEKETAFPLQVWLGFTKHCRDKAASDFDLLFLVNKQTRRQEKVECLYKYALVDV